MGERADVFVHDERGRVLSVCPKTGEQKEMAYDGFEKGRGFTPIARSSDKWTKAYARRTAVERVNSRLDRLLGFEQHFIRGQAKMEARVSLALLVMVTMALGRIQGDQAELMRSFAAPVRKVA